MIETKNSKAELDFIVPIKSTTETESWGCGGGEKKAKKKNPGESTEQVKT